MKKIVLVFAAMLFVFVAAYASYSYLSREAFIREADANALKLNQVAEQVGFEDLSGYFGNTKGSFVLFDRNRNQYLIYNEAESQKRASSVSTFKILNSLIGLETKVLQDENTLFKWNGKHNYIDAWNRDHTLASAFSNSVVWYYQEVASKVGKERMQGFLREAKYGNADISGGLTEFWLDSSLRISPLEQVAFLRRFYSYELPFSRSNIDTVKKIMVMTQDDRVTLSGKTGLAGNHLGWFVGYVERDENVFFFATKVTGNNIENPTARKITQDILRGKGIQ